MNSAFVFEKINKSQGKGNIRHVYCGHQNAETFRKAGSWKFEICVNFVREQGTGRARELDFDNGLRVQRLATVSVFYDVIA